MHKLKQTKPKPGLRAFYATSSISRASLIYSSQRHCQLHELTGINNINSYCYNSYDNKKNIKHILVSCIHRIVLFLEAKYGINTALSIIKH